jgi:hypothetical protein
LIRVTAASQSARGTDGSQFWHSGTLPAMTRASVVAAAALTTATALAATARAGCPDDGSPDRSVCRPVSSVFLPTAIGTAYFPGGMLGSWYGAGLEVVGLTWGDSSPAFGPSHGKLRFDISLLRSSEDGLGTMVLYRGGAEVSFEKNPSRSWLIPYFSADVGGLWVRGPDSEGHVDGGVGIYLYYSSRLVVDVGAAWLIPFNDADLLSGPTAQAAVSVALW